MPDVKPIPDSYSRVSAHLSIDRAAAAIDFYASVFCATERMRMGMPDGTVAHRRARPRRLSDHDRRRDARRGRPQPEDTRRSPVALFVYIEDVSGPAISAGAQAVQEPENHFYGDRVAMLDDPFGHRWNIASHVEDVPPDEMERRVAEAIGQA